MISLIVVYVVRVLIVDVFYSVTSCRLVLDHDLNDFLGFETLKFRLGLLSDILDTLTAFAVLSLFRHYLRKQFVERREAMENQSLTEI
jgi:hypothetical protein